MGQVKINRQFFVKSTLKINCPTTLNKKQYIVALNIELTRHF
jgi:hypothetical protein